MGKLYVVPTPIGNFEDITLRALRILKEADYILAEDTRTTGILLKHFNISNKMVAHHKFNEHFASNRVLSDLQGGLNIALVTDAGTPGIADPGFFLVRLCIENQIDVETLPGAVAFIPALVNSGFPCDKFYFYGFLPHKKGRNKAFTFISQLEQTVILYESPHRILKTISQLGEFISTNRRISVSREISKIYEETIRGTVEEVKAYFASKTVKGEFVVVISADNQDYKTLENSEE